MHRRYLACGASEVFPVPMEQASSKIVPFPIATIVSCAHVTFRRGASFKLSSTKNQKWLRSHPEPAMSRIVRLQRRETRSRAGEASHVDEIERTIADHVGKRR